MARGITQDQVNRAADAILGAGENPTVEKVRAELGTGSPNTITRMLDSWRAQLGERMRQLSALPAVPEAVGQAMMELWRLATEHAEGVIEHRFAGAWASLEADQALLAKERESWEARLQVAETNAAHAQAARDLAEHACATLDGQLQDSHALRADLVQQRDRLQEQCEQLTRQIQALRTQLDENQAALRAERERAETHVRAIEDRAHQEVDHARQETKQSQLRHATAERTSRAAAAAMQKRYDSAIDQVRRLEQNIARQAGQVAALEKALSEAYLANSIKPKKPPPAPKAATVRGRRKKTTARLRNTE